MDEDEYDLNRKSLKFFVNVQGFRPPFLFTIGFSSPPEDLDLLEFFITFFGCFTAMLLIAAAVWKIKQKWDSYTTNRAHMQEMEMMAARPFGAVRLILPSLEDIDIRHVRCQGKIIPISSEVCFNSQAAVATVVVRLPGCENGCPAVGQSAICFGSCLTPINSEQGQSKSNGVKSRGNKRTERSSR